MARLRTTPQGLIIEDGQIICGKYLTNNFPLCFLPLNKKDHRITPKVIHKFIIKPK